MKHKYTVWIHVVRAVTSVLKKGVTHAVSHSHGPPIKMILRTEASLLLKPKKMCIEEFGQHLFCI